MEGVDLGRATWWLVFFGMWDGWMDGWVGKW